MATLSSTSITQKKKLLLILCSKHSKYLRSIRQTVSATPLLFSLSHTPLTRMHTHPIHPYIPTAVISLVNREDADSRTAGIFMRDTACFHCDSMKGDSYFSESRWKHAVSRMKMPAVRESASSLFLVDIHGRPYIRYLSGVCLLIMSQNHEDGIT